MKSLLSIRSFWQKATRQAPPEVWLWLIGLGLMALLNPHGEHLFSFCPFSWMLESGCPGCGLGHGIAFLARGEWQASWQAHPLASPAVVLLLWRCGRLLYFQHMHPSVKPSN